MITLAWTGGTVPPDDFGPGNDVYEHLLLEQIETYTAFWGTSPDDDTLDIFRNRARLDAWATIRES